MPSELRRVLDHEGELVVATHLGDGDVFADEFLGHGISPVGGALYDRKDLIGLLSAAGFGPEGGATTRPAATRTHEPAHLPPRPTSCLNARRKGRSRQRATGRFAAASHRGTPPSHSASGAQCQSHESPGLGS